MRNEEQIYPVAKSMLFIQHFISDQEVIKLENHLLR